MANDTLNHVSPAATLDLLAKSGGVALGMTYAGGYLTVNMHLGRCGFEWLGLLDATYVAAGLWAAAPVLSGALIASASVLLYRSFFSHEPEDVETRAHDRVVPTTLQTTALSGVMAIGVSSAVLWIIDQYGMLRTVWPVAAMITYVAVLLTDVDRTLRAMAIIYAQVIVIALVYRAFKEVGVQPQSAWWLLPLGVGAALMLTVATPSSRTPVVERKLRADLNGIALLVLLAPAYFAGPAPPPVAQRRRVIQPGNIRPTS